MRRWPRSKLSSTLFEDTIASMASKEITEALSTMRNSSNFALLFEQSIIGDTNTERQCIMDFKSKADWDGGYHLH